MSVIANDLSRFDGDVQAFEAACKNFDRSYATLKSDMLALQGMWEGEAHDALWERFSTDYASLGVLVEHMKAVERSLRNAKSSYTACENKVRSTVSSLNF